MTDRLEQIRADITRDERNCRWCHTVRGHDHDCPTQTILHLLAELDAARSAQTRLEEALREASLSFELTTKFNHREWHFEHNDKPEAECPDCEGRRERLERWKALLAPSSTLGSAE